MKEIKERLANKPAKKHYKTKERPDPKRKDRDKNKEFGKSTGEEMDRRQEITT